MVDYFHVIQITFRILYVLLVFMFNYSSNFVSLHKFILKIIVHFEEL